ncbi:DUF2264 domain-containing protein [Microtetraspora sp. NBRC 16547]|uniref:DUF2264 domain-containing protein n=1 Tax=Microtetraspora sp. NBRC 16547 TaxID=3030993 RepID=UPI0024A3B245|nr:DUF2264 domain-containing protein [Microtetraspora sp. NBRC 16547]GLW99288.1 hypothetical protein Misp02_33750 [Microtetraspora sp. NBRC 16547]
MFDLPEEDRSLSPYTGWTRRHWETVADGLLAAVEPYRSADGATIRLPGRASWSNCEGMEGFARTFLIAAFRVAGGGPVELLAPYRSGFVNGPGVWPAVADHFQPMVECASLALGLWLTRRHLWDGLGAGERERLAAYLATVFDHEPADNNWWLFPVTVGGFLASAGLHVDASRAAIARGLARIEPWHAGSGWYSDGPGRAFDHYNGWALHFYPILYGLLSGVPMPVHEERLREFLGSFALTFGGDGRPLYQGRSMTYRFAAAASLMLGGVTGSTPLSPGATRRLASGSLRHALEHGALSDENLLTLGWYGPHEASLQPYSGSASPYWAAKAFAGLLAPADHPLWTAVEEPGPEGLAVLPGPGLLVLNSGGVARLVNHGSQDQPGDPLYDRCAYSSHTGPTAPGEIPDNHFGLVLGDGTVTARGLMEPRGAGSVGKIAWTASSAGGVESVTVLRGRAEVRVHRVAPGSSVRQSGWALPRATAAIDGLSVSLTSADAPPSRLVGLHGYGTASAPETTSGTAFGHPALVPVLDGVTEDGWAVALAVLGEGDGTVPSVEVGEQITLRWPDRTQLTLTAQGPAI